ncbi:hypothetical protein LCGC14_1624730 [marine sediment metagenome]|uniref:Uncharacterized protein n=1 Tax=marine sediment metagenome TaxID=412755 RepID=A0A0F9I4N6_9ZZZZ
MLQPDKFYQQVTATVERHGEKARKLWQVAAGYNPMVPPAAALGNLKSMVDVIRADFEDEARSLITDLEQLFKQ